MHEGIRPPQFREPKAAAQAPQATEAGPARPNRKPFGSMQLKLAYDIRQGFHGHWFNDIPGRVDRAKEAGYEHVKDKQGNNVERIVGTAEGGGGLKAYLLEIPEEWYQADMKIEQDHVAEKEEMIRRGNLDAPEQGYVGQQGITIKS